MAGKFRALAFACVLLGALCSMDALAREVTVTVTVLDPDETPIQHAVVQVMTSASMSEIPSARTDARGAATLTVDIPNAEPLRVRAFVLDAPKPDGLSFEELTRAVRDRTAIRQFGPLGYATIIRDSASTASLVIKADPVESRTGRLTGHDAEEECIVNLFTTLPRRALTSITGAYTLPTPTGRPFDLLIEPGDGEDMVMQHIHALDRGEQLPDIAIELADKSGAVTGIVAGMDPDDTRYLPLAAVRTDGGYMHVLLVAPDGRLEHGASGTADPEDPSDDKPIAPGEYYVLRWPEERVTLSLFALLTAIRTNTAQQERDALVRLTIHADQRTVVEWDAAKINSTTDDLVNAVLFTP